MNQTFKRGVTDRSVSPCPKLVFWSSSPLSQDVIHLGNGIIADVVPLVFVQSPSHVQLFVTSWTVAHQASLSFTVSLSLLKLMSIESVMPSNLGSVLKSILCHPLLLLPWTFPSIRVFSSESALHIWWPKYRGISSPNEYSGLISFRIDWLDLLAVHGTL